MHSFCTNVNSLSKACHCLYVAQPHCSRLYQSCVRVWRARNLQQAAGEGFVNALAPALVSRLILNGEVVIQEQEPPMAWWLISRGVVGLYRNGRKFAELDDGHFFGDVGLLFGVKAPFTVRTETPCQFYTIDRYEVPCGRTDGRQRTMSLYSPPLCLLAGRCLSACFLTTRNSQRA